MAHNLYPIYTESLTEASATYYPDNILSTYSSEDITESLNNNTLISSINSMVTFQSNLKQRNANAKELPNELLLKIFNYLDNMEDILNLRCVNKKFKSLSEVKLYDIIEEKIKTLENKKVSLERRLNHMKNHLCPRLSQYKVFLNVISRSDVTELCNLPKPPREVKYIFSVLYTLYIGGKNCQCLQCLENKSVNNDNDDSIEDEKEEKESIDECSSSSEDETLDCQNKLKDINCSTDSAATLVEKEEEIIIPNWEEVKQVINKNDFRNWVMNLHSNLDAVPREHILLANNLLNKPRTTNNSKSTSNSNSASSEYDNLLLTQDHMLIVSQIGYKVLLFIEAIIQSSFLTERFEKQKNSISLVYEQIHQWKDLQLQCKNY